MRTMLWTAGALALVLTAGCSDKTTAHAGGPSATSPSHSSSETSHSSAEPAHSSAGPSHSTAAAEAPPSQSDLDAQAAREINDSNADSEFEKLKREIEGGGH